MGWELRIVLICLLTCSSFSNGHSQALLPATPYIPDISAEQSREFLAGTEYRKLAFAASSYIKKGFYYALQGTYRPLVRWGKEPFIEDEDMSFGFYLGKKVRVEGFEFDLSFGGEYQLFKVASKPKKLRIRPIPPDSLNANIPMEYTGTNYEASGSFASASLTVSVGHDRIPVRLYSQLKPAYVIEGSYTNIHNYDGGLGWTYGHVTYQEQFRDQVVISAFSGAQLDLKWFYTRFGIGQLVFSNTRGPFPILPNAYHFSAGFRYRF